jgi:hypothetical protein
MAAIWPVLILLFRPIYNALLKTPLGKYLPQLGTHKTAAAGNAEASAAGVIAVTSEEHWEQLHRYAIVESLCSHQMHMTHCTTCVTFVSP